MKNGQILFAASPGLFQEPTHFFLFTTVNGVSSITQVGDTPHSADLKAFVINFLVLPTGQLLQTDTTSKVSIYSPSGTASPAVEPVVTSVPTTLTRGHSYTVSGKQLAGITSGATYGDDAQAGTNFPLVRIVNNATHHVFYAKTSGFSSRGLKPKAASSASFLVPAGRQDRDRAQRAVRRRQRRRVEGGDGHDQLGELSTPRRPEPPGEPSSRRLRFRAPTQPAAASRSKPASRSAIRSAGSSRPTWMRIGTPSTRQGAAVRLVSGWVGISRLS